MSNENLFKDRIHKSHTQISSGKSERNVLVTGGAGFIGSNYVHYHVKKYPNDRLTVLDKLTYAGNLPNIQALIDAGKIDFVKGDIADYDFVLSLFKDRKFDLVINFAAETHVDRSIIDPQVFVLTNIIGTHNLLMASRETDVSRYHQISTDEVYGDLGDNSTDFFTEQTPLSPNPPYAAAKASADLLVLSYYETYGFPVTISRCSNNYGPYQFPEKLIPFFFKIASEGRPLPIYGDGKNVRDWLYVSDHCTAIDLIASSDKYGEIYNIGGHNEKNNLQIADLILKALEQPTDRIKFVEDRKAHDRRYAIDSTKIKNDLGWEPTIMFEDGINMTFDWYKTNSDWLHALETQMLDFIKEK